MKLTYKGHTYNTQKKWRDFTRKTRLEHKNKAVEYCHNLNRSHFLKLKCAVLEAIPR